jgi:hypothetical protein
MSLVFTRFLFLTVLNFASRTCFWLGMGLSPFVFCAWAETEKNKIAAKNPIVFKVCPKNALFPLMVVKKAIGETG